MKILQKHKLSCILCGGLGNQLFQIFTTISQGCNTGRKVVFPYESTTVGMTHRKTYWDNFLIGIKSFTTIQITNATTNNEIYNKFNKLHHQPHHYIPITLQDQDTCMIGYFQSYKYFENYKKVIFSLLKLSSQKINLLTQINDTDIKMDINNNVFTTVTPSTLKEKLQIINPETDTYTISIHFRIGDYISVTDCHPILQESYYVNSLKYIMNKLEQKQKQYDNIKIYVFYETKDKNAVELIIQRLVLEYPNIEFIMNISDFVKEDWKQMLLMSCCHANIIANSTYSWWGAYFNEDVDIVTYPNVWFGPKLSSHRMDDMFPNNWVCIKQ
jgi:hypothetical protein